MASLYNGTTLVCNEYVAFEIAVSKYFINKDLYFRFPFSRSHIFTSKTTIFLDDQLYQKIFARR